MHLPRYDNVKQLAFDVWDIMKKQLMGSMCVEITVNSDKGRSQKKTGKCGNFSQVGEPIPPPPLPPVWEPHVCEKKIMVYFAF